MSTTSSSPKFGFFALSLGAALYLTACDNPQISQAPPAKATAPAQIPDPSPEPSPPAPSEVTTDTAPKKEAPHFNVHFSLGSTALSDEAMRTLTSTVDYLRANPETNVKLLGYTDVLGSVERNKQLAEQRVAAAARFLDKNGVQKSRISTSAIGEADSNLTPPGEDPAVWNRRVEIGFSAVPNS